MKNTRAVRVSKHHWAP